MMSGILVISYSATQPEEVIKNILGELPKSEDHYDHVKSYPWHLETKYYTVDLFLHTVEDIIACKEFVDTVEAIIIHFDPLTEKSFSNLADNLYILESYEAEVQILACNSLCQVRDEMSNKYLEWCVKNKYELVELSSSHNEENDDEEKEDDYEEITGYRRILGALQAHVWPNLKMKDEQCQFFAEKHEIKMNLNTKDDQRSQSAEGANASSEKKSKEKEELTRNERLDTLFDNEFFHSLENGDGSLCFEELFQKFSEMKEKAGNLTGEERRQYAEKVTIAFWKAIGGDEEEIAGLSDD